MSQAALAVSDVHKRYEEHYAVKGVSFAVREGTICGLLGPNGAGKTTVLRMINAILRPDKGSIAILGDKTPGPEAQPHIGYLPEERGLYQRMRVADVIAFFGRLRGMSGADATSAALRWLSDLELSQWAKSRVQELSKGMQQKVQFASALIHDPKLLILDEPWSGLDPINAEVLRDIVLRHRKQGKSVLFSTHQISSAEKMCDDVCIIARGQVAAFGHTQKLKEEAKRGPSLTLRVKDHADIEELARLVGDSESVTDIKVTGDSVVASLAKESGTTHALEIAAGLASKIGGLSIQEPTLEDVFMDKVKGHVSAQRDV